ncbi:MAG TPA: response regulator transcription factor [Pseudonocardia sp.]|uniref:response regulator transcription factor n=1 Tax=Pseudonocardia sp. TaxID=60912 RepID=UPI002ED9FA23
MPHVLVIEDDADVRRGLMRSLAVADIAATSASTGMAGLQAALESAPDLIVLDLGLPDIQGNEVLRMVRAVSEVPIIVATSCDEERQIVTMLDAGADDYLVKPFGGEQFVARIRATLRRGRLDTRKPKPALSIGGLVIEQSARTATLDGKDLRLAPREFDMLYYLAERHGEVVTKRELLTEVWQVPFSGTDKTVDVHLSWLRRKLGESAQFPRYLHTVRGVGLRLSAPTS